MVSSRFVNDSFGLNRDTSRVWRFVASMETFDVPLLDVYGFLFSVETVVLRRWGSETKIWFYQTS